MVRRRSIIKSLAVLFIVISLGVGAYLGRGLYGPAITIHELLTQNKDLKQAITTLTTEDQIGYAKVIEQQQTDGGLMTKLLFVETARDDKTRKILEKEYTIQGDVIHFDALIVKFNDQIVMNGKSKAIFLWRRVYGESMAPQDGLPIEEPGSEPKRYKDLFSSLSMKHQSMFWSNIWDLANDPEKLKNHGIEAIYGNAIYSKLRPGLIYVFKIGPTGQVYPEVVPDI